MAASSLEASAFDVLDVRGVPATPGLQYTEKYLIDYLLAAPGLISDDTRNLVRRLYKNDLRPAGHLGLFTWDGDENAITASPLWPSSFSWI